MIYLYVGLGGILGSLTRYLLSMFGTYLWGRNFPIGTMIINLTGAFILGFLTNKLAKTKERNPQLFTALTTGVIGSYTTFSTFCVETIRLLEVNQYLYALLYFILSAIGGLYFVHLGLKVGVIGRKKEGNVS
ncbi:fluoride efflux transporter CrcB [Bacillus sp. JJ1764]|uniref:fluoride efflux transporter CrcB n=1 Tax=Bacillus sp. JJ1764 TaxID=3122964 RepID=UPI002FFF1B84